VIERFDWRAAALASGVLLLTLAFPLGWFGARDPNDAATARRDRASWGECLPYLRDRSMILLFAARFSCGVGLFQTVHLVGIALQRLRCRHRSFRCRRFWRSGGVNYQIPPTIDDPLILDEITADSATLGYPTGSARNSV
jgi:hypothetical protein